MYIFTFTLFALFAYNDVFIKNKILFRLFGVLAVTWLIFHDGFRWGIGTDWDNYYNYFENIYNDNHEKLEIGYEVLTNIVRSFSENYSVFLVIHAVIVYSLISKTVFRFSINPFLSFLFLYSMMLTYLGMSRQYIAFAIIMYSYKYIIDKKFIFFILCISIAYLFHRSALLFIFAYFVNRQWSQKFILISLITVAIISISGIINLLPLNVFYLLNDDIGTKMTSYGDSNLIQANIFFTILSLLKRTFWIIIVLFFRSKIKNEKGYFDFIFNLYFISTLIYIVFNNTILQVIVARGLLYYNIAEIFLIPYILSLVKMDFLKKVAFLMLLIYGYLTINKAFEFYKKDLGVDIFRPYNSVLINSNYNAMNGHSK